MRILSIFLTSLWALGSIVQAQDDGNDPTPTPTPTDPTDPNDPDPTETPTPLPTGIDSFSNVTIYQPDVLTSPLTFPRTESLPNNTVLAAFNDPSQANNTLQLFRSTNSGFSWYNFGTATSSVTGSKLLQPHLLYINDTFAGDQGITVLAANAVGTTTTAIETFASYDKGESWEYTGTVVKGGAQGSSTAVGSPFLVYAGSKITIYYTQGLKIVQRTTSDLYENQWGSVIDTIATPATISSVSAVSVAKISASLYIYAFETTPTNSSTANPIAYKLSTNAENAGTAPIFNIATDTGAVPAGAPSVTWSPLGNANGTIVLSDSRSSSVWINQALGQGTWHELQTVAGRGEGREVRVPDNDTTRLRVAGGAEEGRNTPGQILLSMLNFEKVLATLS